MIIACGIGLKVLGERPPLVGAAGAVPELEPGAVGRAGAGGVEASSRARVAQLAVRLGRPLLVDRARAVPELGDGAVAGARRVEALAQGADRVAVAGPLLGVGAVAGPELNR